MDHLMLTIIIWVCLEIVDDSKSHWIRIIFPEAHVAF